MSRVSQEAERESGLVSTLSSLTNAPITARPTHNVPFAFFLDSESSRCDPTLITRTPVSISGGGPEVTSDTCPGLRGVFQVLKGLGSRRDTKKEDVNQAAGIFPDQSYLTHMILQESRIERALITVVSRVGRTARRRQRL